MWQTEHSKLDDSVNFIYKTSDSFIECRYVRREEEQVVVYLSSHRGCNQACRFCHLTATGQTDMTPVQPWMFAEQASQVLDYWRSFGRTGNETKVNFNFMARGEPLENHYILDQWKTVESGLYDSVGTDDLSVRFNVSSIIPMTFQDKQFADIFDPLNVKLYWSLYSVEEKFRKRWLPKAMSPVLAADKIRNWISVGGRVVLHNALIRDENDNLDSLLDFLQKEKLTSCDYNIVHYNPANERHGEETVDKHGLARDISRVLTGRVQVIPRVGFDVNASCGTFHS